MVGEPKRYVVAAVCLLVLALGAAGVGTGAADAQSTSNGSALAVADETVEPDATTSVRVSLDGAPTGISGFALNLSVADASVATITDVSLGDAFTTPGGEPAVAQDGASARLTGVDLEENVQSGVTNVTLATVTVSGVEAGSTTLEAEPTSMDDDDGGDVDPTVDAGTVTVGSAGSGDGTSGDSGPGFTVATGVVVLLAVGLVASRAT